MGFHGIGSCSNGEFIMAINEAVSSESGLVELLGGVTTASMKL